MDLIQDYLPLLTQFLPPSLLNTLISLATTTFGIGKTLQTHLTPLFLKITTQPDIVSILLLVAVLWLSLQVIGMAYRAIMFWINLALRLAFWGLIAGVGFWIYNRGFDGFVNDVNGLMSRWMDEYERFSGDVKKFQGQKERQFRKQQGKRTGGW